MTKFLSNRNFYNGGDVTKSQFFDNFVLHMHLSMTQRRNLKWIKWAVTLGTES